MRHVVFIFLLMLFLIAAFIPLGDRETNGFLRVSEKQVVDGNGDPVILKGFNIALKDFFGPLGEEDIRRVAELGANNIRLVMEYHHLESAPFVYDEKGFDLLDSIVSWCEKYQVYLILDMHLVPGIQNLHDFVVHQETNVKFWKESQYQERFYALWREIAHRYADRRIIAAYDLLNEGVAPDEEQYLKVINTATENIRQVDSHHILIIEEAIKPNGSKKILPVADDNVIYSIHFFYPPQFTFYTTTRQRTVTHYPGEMMVSGKAIDAVKSPVVSGTGDWQQVTLQGTPPDGADILQVLLLSDEHHGQAWFDDIRLDVDGDSVDLPAPLVANGSFEVSYPGISWETHGNCAEVTNTAAKQGAYAIEFANCNGPTVVLSSPIAVTGNRYTLSAWLKLIDARGSNRIALSWHKAKTLASFNKTTLRDRLDYALRFRAWRNVPLYVGEFTVHANPSTESVSNYLKDILDILESEKLHWSYWTYYSEYPGIGFYTGKQAYLARPENLKILSDSMQKQH